MVKSVITAVFKGVNASKLVHGFKYTTPPRKDSVVLASYLPLLA